MVTDVQFQKYSEGIFKPYLQFTASSGHYSVFERPFFEANGRPFVS